MTTAPQAFGSGMTMPAEAIHVTGRRVVATIIDGFIFGVVYWLLPWPSATSRPRARTPTGSATSPAGSASSTACSCSATTSCSRATGGQTVGKMATGIKVVSETTGGPPGIGAAAVRTVLRIVDGLFTYLVAFVTVLVSAKRQRLGDMAAHTLVVRI